MHSYAKPKCTHAEWCHALVYMCSATQATQLLKDTGGAKPAPEKNIFYDMEFPDTNMMWDIYFDSQKIRSDYPFKKL